MHIVTTIKTSQGPRRLPPPPMIRFSVTPSELYALILIVERDRAEAAREGRFSAADHLAHRALALRRASP